MHAKIKLFSVLFLIVFVLGSCGTFHFMTKTTVEYKVQDKEAVGGEDSKYLIYTEDNRVFENRDSIFELKWNSSDVYATLEKGKCYRSEAWGFRIPFLSTYQGIDQAQEIPCNQ